MRVKKLHREIFFKLAGSLQDFIDNLYEETPVSYGRLSDIYDGDDEEIKKLLLTDWEVNTPDESGSTLIQRALVGNKIWLVKELISRSANLNGTIERAMRRNNVEIIELLLKSGADIEERNLSKYTPLQSAVMGNKPEIVELLLKYGADKTIKNHFERTPLDVAILKKNDGIDMDEIIKLLSE